MTPCTRCSGFDHPAHADSAAPRALRSRRLSLARFAVLVVPAVASAVGTLLTVAGSPS